MNKNTTTLNKDGVRVTLLSKKGMHELRKALTQLEHDRYELIRQLREMSKVNNHDDRLQRVEKLAELEVVESALEEKHQILANARLMPTRRARLKVAIGSVVDLIDQQGRLVRYTIVESIEANPSDGRISVASPLGQNLVGKTVHDMVEWSQGIRRGSLRLVNIT